MNPATLGAPIAFHEHRTFGNAVLRGVNPFDQYAVELEGDRQEDRQGGEGFGASTEALLSVAGLR